MFTFKNKLVLTVTLLLSFVSVQLFAQAAAPVVQQTKSAWSNPLFLLLLLVNIILLVFIAVLANVYRQAAWLYFKRMKENSSTIKTIALLIGLTFVSGQLFAQDGKVAQAVAPVVDSTIGGLSQAAFYWLLGAAIFQLSIIFFLLVGVRNFIQTQEKEAVEAEVKKPSFIDQFNESVAIENEADIMFDHEYDGIRELDNNLPPWWKYGFYLTIVVSIIYLFVYHVSKTADLQDVEYKKEMAKAAKELEEFRKNSANSVDENTVVYLTDASELASGKQMFLDNCAACHGKLGEGTVGPNLTDEYWLHGGSINNIFKSIKYGIVDKGMKSWQEDFSPAQMAQISSYVKSLKGTNPANPKEKQGDLYVEGVAAPKDSTAVAVVDSTIVINKDSIK